jgi:tetratricopeptide (TPR) repeat protein
MARMRGRLLVLLTVLAGCASTGGAAPEPAPSSSSEPDPAIAPALARWQAGDLDGALVLARGAVGAVSSADPVFQDLARAFRRRAEERCARGDLTGSARDHETVLALAPSIPRDDIATPYLARAADREAAKDWNGAVEAYGWAIVFEPERARTYADRACAYVARGDLESARGDCSRALCRDPSCGRAFWARALTKEQVDPDLALQDLALAEKHGFALSGALLRRAALDDGGGGLDEAIAAARRALALTRARCTVRAELARVAKLPEVVADERIARDSAAASWDNVRGALATLRGEKEARAEIEALALPLRERLCKCFLAATDAAERRGGLDQAIEQADHAVDAAPDALRAAARARRATVVRAKTDALVAEARGLLTTDPFLAEERLAAARELDLGAEGAAALENDLAPLLGRRVPTYVKSLDVERGPHGFVVSFSLGDEAGDMVAAPGNAILEVDGCRVSQVDVRASDFGTHDVVLNGVTYGPERVYRFEGLVDHDLGSPSHRRVAVRLSFRPTRGHEIRATRTLDARD